MIKTKDYVLREISGVPLLMCTTVPYHGCWMYELNSVGRLIWDVCEKFTSVEEMIPYISGFFRETITGQQEKSIKNYCERLCQLGLIKDEK